MDKDTILALCRFKDGTVLNILAQDVVTSNGNINAQNVFRYYTLYGNKTVSIEYSPVLNEMIKNNSNSYIE